MDLKDEVRAQYKRYEALRLLNRNLSIGLGVLGIAFSLLATIVGLFGDLTLGTLEKNEQPPIVWLRDFTPWAPKIAAALAAISATLQAALFAYPVTSRAIFYSKVVAALKNIELDLAHNTLSESELAKLGELKEILITAANEESQGDATDPQTIEKIQEAIKAVNNISGSTPPPTFELKSEETKVTPEGDSLSENLLVENLLCGTRAGIQDELAPLENLCGTRDEIPAS